MQCSEHIQESIRYIYGNLTTEISLELLAGHVHFSPFHFHRQFLLCTGEAPMEYLRRLRIRAASRELLLIDSSIVDIAAKFSFESQDGFCRAFKRYYGITPGEYRKLNFKLEYCVPRKTKETKTIMYNSSVYECLAACSFDDKKEALATLDRVLELSSKAKNSGLISLEQELESPQPELFRKSIQLLVDGIEPESLREILLNCTNG